MRTVGDGDLQTVALKDHRCACETWRAGTAVFVGMLVTGVHKDGDPRDVLEASHLSPDWSVWNLCDTGRDRFLRTRKAVA